jgi:mono/diheme cytochrome c family protein
MLTLAACSNGSLKYTDIPATGDPSAGAQIFKSGTQDATACSACHSTDGSPETGPSLRGVGTHDAAYLFQSIVYPNDQIAAGYAAGIMPQNYGTALTPQQIRDLIGYLQTLQ